MYMSRDIMHCKPGKAKELVESFKKLALVLKEQGRAPMRVYTDICGEDYWTVVVEQEIASLDEMAEMSRSAMTDERLQAAFKGYHDLVNSGRREYYKVE